MRCFQDMSLLLTPSNSFLGKALRLPLRLIPAQTVVTVRSGLIRGMKWRVGSSIHGCWLGTYELAKQRAVRDLVKPGMNVVDIGANAGYYTLAFSALVGPTGHVWAIEPFASNLSSLLNHVAINDLRNITVVQSAVAESIGLAHFRAHESNSMGALSTEPTRMLVPTISLDVLLASGVPTPNVIKMDIEGGELQALRGAASLLAQRRTTWFVALDDPQNADECRRILTLAGYSISELDSKHEIIARPN